MRKILLLISVITIFSSCDKDEKLTLQEVIHLLQIEKTKVNQDSLVTLIEGDWYETNSADPIHLKFSSNPLNFKYLYHSWLDEPGKESIELDVDDFFFVKVDPYLNTYRIIAFHNRFNENCPDFYGIIKITKEYIFYTSIDLPSEARDEANIVYQCIMTKMYDSFDIENYSKFHRAE